VEVPRATIAALSRGPRGQVAGGGLPRAASRRRWVSVMVTPSLMASALVLRCPRRRPARRARPGLRPHGEHRGAGGDTAEPLPTRERPGPRSTKASEDEITAFMNHQGQWARFDRVRGDAARRRRSCWLKLNCRVPEISPACCALQRPHSTRGAQLVSGDLLADLVSSRRGVPGGAQKG